MKLLWLTDIHLDHVNPASRLAFYDKLRSAVYDAVVITGDISVSRLLETHLGELARACYARPVYFVLGNHDFYGASFEEVDKTAAMCCIKHSNLRHLGSAETITLTRDVALLGHRGWADGRAYGGYRTSHAFPEQQGIRDLRFNSTYTAFRKMEQLGRQSGNYFRRILPYALTRYRHVLLATHVPPFARAVRFNNRPCAPEKLPHYVNARAGAVIRRIGDQFPKTRITVLSGHTHHAATIQIAANLEIEVGQARRGHPEIQRTIEI